MVPANIGKLHVMLSITTKSLKTSCTSITFG